MAETTEEETHPPSPVPLDSASDTGAMLAPRAPTDRRPASSAPPPPVDSGTTTFFHIRGRAAALPPVPEPPTVPTDPTDPLTEVILRDTPAHDLQAPGVSTVSEETVRTLLPPLEEIERAGYDDAAVPTPRDPSAVEGGHDELSLPPPLAGARDPDREALKALLRRSSDETAFGIGADELALPPPEPEDTGMIPLEPFVAPRSAPAAPLLVASRPPAPPPVSDATIPLAEAEAAGIVLPEAPEPPAPPASAPPASAPPAPERRVAAEPASSGRVGPMVGLVALVGSGGAVVGAVGLGVVVLVLALAFGSFAGDAPEAPAEVPLPPIELPSPDPIEVEAPPEPEPEPDPEPVRHRAPAPAPLPDPEPVAPAPEPVLAPVPELVDPLPDLEDPPDDDDDKKRGGLFRRRK
ncbi:MAG: hypothetical protein R3F59_19395 [Myxococcota bacterium]